MTPVLENSILVSTLDCAGFKILNLNQLDPVPPTALDLNDPSLSNPRTPSPGSVTNSSVSDLAAIDQGKINFNGTMPSLWLGTTSTQAAEGNLSELASNKGLATGYASLDSNGLIPSAQVPTGAGLGTINSVFLSMVPRHFATAGPNPITTSGTWTVTWLPVPNNSILGVDGPVGPGQPVRPKFITDRLDISLLPTLDASQFAGSITFALPLLPPARYGATHNAGIIPDPGRYGNPASYLGRDMHWHDFPVNDPVLPYPTSPQIMVKFEPNNDGSYTVVVLSTLEGSVLFYSQNGAAFQEAVQDKGDTDIVIALNAQYGDHIEAYVAKAGYNDSPIAVYDVTPPPGDQ